MTSAFVDRYPIRSYIILCYAITWGVWFTIPVFAGDNWTLIKVLTGVGVGPGIAAVLIDRIRNGAKPSVCGDARSFAESWARPRQMVT